MNASITQQDIEQWIKQAYDTACKHGFHDKEYSDEHWYMLITSEISEAVEADRKDIHADPKEVNALHRDSLNKDNKAFPILFKKFVKDSQEDEIADICIRIFDFAGLRKIKFSDSFFNDIHKAYEIFKEGELDKKAFTEFAFLLVGALVEDHKHSGDDGLANILLVLIAYCEFHNINLKQHIELKMLFNELRPYKNGKNY